MDHAIGAYNVINSIVCIKIYIRFVHLDCQHAVSEAGPEIRKLVTQPAMLGESTLAEESIPRWVSRFLLYGKKSNMMLALEITSSYLGGYMCSA